MEAFVIPLILVGYAMSTKSKIHDTPGNQVFIVEDDEMHSLMLDYMLSKDTVANIKKFKTGEDCLDHLSQKPDVVILDYGLPGINGMQTLKQIRKYDPEIPVIVVTGNKSEELLTDFKKEGVFDFVQKNEDAFEQVSKITDSILNAIGHQKAKQEKRQRTIYIAGILLMAVITVLSIWLIVKNYN